jgi:four helix bundle protein
LHPLRAEVVEVSPSGREAQMALRIYEEIVSMVRDMGGIAKKIAGHDPDLARQLRRAATSVLLNVAEGSDSQGRNQRAKYWIALGSARETRACIDAAMALEYVDGVDEDVVARLHHVTAVLVRLVR